jgi:hypothetical protein
MFLCQGEGLAILGDETLPVKAPATLLASPGVSGNFPSLDVETTTDS